MRQRGVLAYLMIILITVIGLVNFFAQFFTDYRTDPLITYGFMALASAIAGFKGVGQVFFRKMNNALTKEPTEEKE